MVWAGVSDNGRTDLRVFKNRTVNGQRYKDETLALYMVPYADAVGQEFILMDDNATAHRARIVNAYLEDRAFTGCTGQHGHRTSIQSSMPGTCCRDGFQPVN